VGNLIYKCHKAKKLERLIQWSKYKGQSLKFKEVDRGPFTPEMFSKYL